MTLRDFPLCSDSPLTLIDFVFGKNQSKSARVRCYQKVFEHLKLLSSLEKNSNIITNQMEGT